MNRLTLCCALVVFASGCAKSKSYTVGSNELVVHDSGYYTAPFFCEGAGMGQIQISFVDYKPICGQGFMDPQTEHNELQLFIVYDASQKYNVPYTVSPPNCMLGPAGPGWAYFNHYADGSSAAQQTVAQSGNIFITSYDSTGKNPIEGSFELDFGDGGMVKDNFSVFTCE
jgi:hypothetical protein